MSQHLCFMLCTCLLHASERRASPFITLGVHTEWKIQIKCSQNSAKISNMVGLSSSASAHVRRSNILNVNINFRLPRLGSQTCSRTDYRRLCVSFLVTGEDAARSGRAAPSKLLGLYVGPDPAF